MTKKKDPKDFKPNGRPPLYTDPKALEDRGNQYFLECDAKEEPYLITGLCYYLGFSSKQNFYDYENKPEFQDSIKRLRLKVESSYEKHLFKNASSGAIFALKNFGWKDKQEIDVNQKRDYSKLSIDELLKIASLNESND